MRYVCAWRKTELGVRAGDPGPVSHGLCEECKRHLKAEIGVPIRHFLDELGAPVALVDSDGRVKTASAQALALLGKDRSEIEGALGGEVFECVYSREPGGCGGTVHCSGCTVRMLVTDTHRTGRSHVRQPAVLQRDTGSGSRPFDLRISTEKVGDVVLLRIEEMTADE